MFAGRMAAPTWKLPTSITSMMPLKPLLPGFSPRRSQKAIRIGTISRMRPTVAGITKQSTVVTSIVPISARR